MNSVIKRKKRHLEAVDNSSKLESVFDEYRLKYDALPGINYDEIDTTVDFLGAQISFPFYISAMSGGVEHGDEMNRILAQACEKVKLPFVSGSVRIALEDQSLERGFDLKPILKSVPYLLNIGAAQLKYSALVERLLKMIVDLGVDGIFIHLNPLQEAVQTDGNRDWSGISEAIKAFVKQSTVPVFVKEVGHGLSANVISSLAKFGIAGFDVSGQGGLSWGAVEANGEGNSRLASIVGQIGYSTPTLITEAYARNPKWLLIAGGGVRSGLDVVKALCLGARMGTAATPFLKAAKSGDVDLVVAELKSWQEEFKLGLFALGASKPAEIFGRGSDCLF